MTPHSIISDLIKNKTRESVAILKYIKSKANSDFRAKYV
jgi:hypothetical protein